MTNKSNYFDNSSVLVTGGAGAIGSNLVSRLSEAGADEVVILDDLSSGYRWLVPEQDNVTFIEGSVLDEEMLKRVFQLDLDYVFHLAAHFANQNSVDHPETDLRVNGMGTLKVLEYAQLKGLDRFVYASSGCGVYGGNAEIPYEEDDFTIRHDTPYQITKQLGEMYGYYFNELFDLPIANARFFNSFGPGEVPGEYRNVIPNFMYWAMKGQALPITGDGSESRDWTYVGDIVNGLVKLATVDDAIGGAFNLATGNETRVIEMAEAVNNVTGNDAGVEYIDRRDWDNKTQIVGSIERSRRVLGYDPKTSFDEGVERVHEWFKDNFERIDKFAEF